MFDYFRIPGTTSIHEMKLAAWALFIGERSRGGSTADRTARSHRGMLPDVDPTALAPDPNYRPLLRRLTDFVRSAAGPVEALEIAPTASLSGAPASPVGKSASVKYIATVEPRRAVERSPTQEKSDLDHPRAA